MTSLLRRAPLAALASVLLLLGVAGCDGTPVLFPNAESVEFLAGDGAGSGPGTPPADLRGEVGLPLSPAPTVRLVDGSGNPAPGVTVEVDVAGGGGSLARTTRVSDRRGVVRLDDWTLGEQAGANRLRVRIRTRGASSAGPEAPALELDARGEPGPPAALEILGEGGAAPPSFEGPVGQELPPLLRFLVLDRFQNPVPGAGILADFLGTGGSLPSTTATTDASGQAELGRWTLGPAAGIQRLRVAATGTAGVALELQASAIPGPAATLEVEGFLPEQGAVGAILPGERFVAALDAFGNPVPGVRVTVAPDGAPAAAGSVAASQVVTGSNGRAVLPGWTLGTQAGPQRLRLSVEGAPGAPPAVVAMVEVLAVDGPPPLEGWTLEAVHLNQGNQTFEGTLPLVADRGGLLRVFLRGSTTSPPGVQVRVRLRQNGSVVLDQTVTRGGGSTIVAGGSDPNDAEASWNVSVPGDLVQPGAELQVEVDPGGILGLGPDEPLTWPSQGGWGLLDVVSLPTFRATFLPVEATYFGLTGRITPGNQGDYLGETVDSFPVSAFDFQVRTTPLVYDGSFANASAGWNGLLQDIRDLRLAEGAFDRYYHGILQRPAGPGIAGLAYIATNPEGIANLAAVSFDQLPAAAEVIAHEFGHNFGRRHAPCANPSGIDPGFPHANGGLGSPGYSLARGLLRPTTEFRDTMGYCFPMWTSDYTWGGILAMRALRPVGGPPVAASVGTPTSFASAVGLSPAAASPPSPVGLLVGGHWSGSETPALRTPIPLGSPTTPQDPHGEVQIELLDGQGRVVARGRYPAAEVDHAEDASLRHFGAVLPMPGGPGSVAAVRVVTPAGSTRWGVSPGVELALGAMGVVEGAPGTPATVTATRVAADASPLGGAFRSSTETLGGLPADDAWRIEWDAERWPVLVLSDPDSGQIRGFLRSGNALVRSGGAVDRLAFMITDGRAALRVTPELR